MVIVDARIPVLFGPPTAADAEDALLLEAGAPLAAGRAMLIERLGVPPVAAHQAGCACCAPRSALARLLSGLALARARGQVGFFRRVVIASEDASLQAGVRAALAHDPLAAACFRLVESVAPRAGASG